MLLSLPGQRWARILVDPGGSAPVLRCYPQWAPAVPKLNHMLLSRHVITETRFGFAPFMLYSFPSIWRSLTNVQVDEGNSYSYCEIYVKGYSILVFYQQSISFPMFNARSCLPRGMRGDPPMWQNLLDMSHSSVLYRFLEVGSIWEYSIL